MGKRVSRGKGLRDPGWDSEPKVLQQIEQDSRHPCQHLPSRPGASHPVTLHPGFGTYQAHSSPGKKLAQPLGTSPEELAQGADPRQAQWHPEETVEDTEEAASWGLGSHVAIT